MNFLSFKILYQLTKFQYQIFFTIQDINQCVFKILNKAHDNVINSRINLESAPSMEFGMVDRNKMKKEKNFLVNEKYSSYLFKCFLVFRVHIQPGKAGKQTFF